MKKINKVEALLSLYESVSKMTPAQIYQDAAEVFASTVEVRGYLGEFADNAVSKITTKIEEEDAAELIDSISTFLVFSMFTEGDMVEPIKFMTGDREEFRYFVHTLCITVIGALVEDKVL